MVVRWVFKWCGAVKHFPQDSSVVCISSYSREEHSAKVSSAITIYYTTLHHICWVKPNTHVLLLIPKIVSRLLYSTSHFVTKCISLRFCFQQPFVRWSLVLSINQKNNCHKDTIPVFLYARWLLFFRWFLHVLMILKTLALPNPDL